MGSNITLILTGYKRTRQLKDMIVHIEQQSILPDDVMLWYNHPGPGYKILKDIPSYVKVVRSSYNYSFYGRFAYGLLAKTKYVCFYDDDIVPGNNWLENCLNATMSYGGMSGGAGYVYNQTHSDKDVLRYGDGGAKVNNIIQVDVAGHSWFMKREWLPFFWEEEPLSWTNCEDVHLSYMLQKHKIKTIVPPQPLSNMNMWANTAHNGLDKDASWREPGFIEEREKLTELYVKRGWRLINRKCL